MLYSYLPPAVELVVSLLVLLVWVELLCCLLRHWRRFGVVFWLECVACSVVFVLITALLCFVLDRVFVTEVRRMHGPASVDLVVPE